MAQSVKEILIELFRKGTPEDPVSIHWQNETFRDIFTQLYPDLAEEAKQRKV